MKRALFNRIHVQGQALVLLGAYLLLLPLQWVGAMLLAAALHELGHLLALWWAGEQVCAITIGPTGARIETGALEGKKALFCALAGPAAGLTLCLFHRWLPRTAILALIQSLYNLLPVYPMDGGRALRGWKQWTNT